MGPVEQIFYPLYLFNVLIGDLGVLWKKSAPSLGMNLLLNVPTFFNIVLNVNMCVVETKNRFILEKNTPNIILMVLCFNLWTVLALVLHIAFTQRLQRVILGIQEIDQQLRNLQLLVNHRQDVFEARTLTVTCAALSTILPVVSHYLSSVKGWKFTFWTTFSWVSSNLTLSAVFLVAFVASSVLRRRSRVLNGGLKRLFRRQQKEKISVLVASDGVRREVKKKSPQWKEETICKFGIAHQKIITVAEDLNFCIAMQVRMETQTLTCSLPCLYCLLKSQIMTFVVPFMVTVQLLSFGLYKKFMDPEVAAISGTEIFLVCSMLLFLVATITGLSLTCDEANGTVRVVHEVLLDEEDSSVTAQLLYFCQQLHHTQLRFSCGLFLLDFSFFKMVTFKGYPKDCLISNYLSDSGRLHFLSDHPHPVQLEAPQGTHQSMSYAVP